MTKAELRVFAKELQVAAFPGDAKYSGLFYFHKGQWHDLHNASVSPAKRSILEGAQASAEPVRESATKALYIYIAELSAVVELRCNANYQRKTIDAVERAVRREYRAAHNEYGATHNILTGLINKSSFFGRLKDTVSHSKAIAQSAAATPTAPEAPQRLCVCAIDIDLFKPINDNYGHDYGDLVLQALAMRLNNKAADHEKDPRLTSIEVAHLSGEEFAILLYGALAEADLFEIATTFLNEVRGTALPSEEELVALLPAGSDLAIPPESERYVTISIGVASVVSSGESGTSAVIARRTLKQADAAMYRAKADGRDRIRAYNDILSKHGRVLEHDGAMGLVAIDIGSNVGVRIGQEFNVYPVPYTGTEPYVIDDGRSRRKLGLYPKRALLQIVAVDVQNEIAFCRVAEPRFLDKEVPKNSVLEAIPLGTISRPVADIYDEGSHGVLSSSELRRTLTSVKEQTPDLSVIVFAIRDVEQIIASRGNFEVNRALSVLYEALEDSKPANARIGKTELAELALIGEVDCDQFVDAVLGKVAQYGGRKFELSIGAFDRAAYETAQTEADKSEFAEGAEIDLARYACANTREPNKLTLLLPDFVQTALGNSRWSGRVADTVADFRRLSAVGLVNAYAFNQVAMAALALRPADWQYSLDCLRTARGLVPGEPLFKANEAFVLSLYCGQYAEALDLYADAFTNISVSAAYRYSILVAIDNARAKFKELTPSEQAKLLMAIESFSEDAEVSLVLRQNADDLVSELREHPADADDNDQDLET
jgi:diguanylate cyclase (GGDEF)-like protein